MDEGLSKKRGAHISGRLKNYMRWPIAMAIMLLLLNLWIYCIDIKAGTLMLIFMLIYIVGIGILYVYSRSLIMKDLIEFAAQYGVVQNTLLNGLRSTIGRPAGVCPLPCFLREKGSGWRVRVCFLFSG